MGTDFNYESAEQYFINIDKIIRAVNRNGTIRAQSQHSGLLSLMQVRGCRTALTWSVKSVDFFQCQLTQMRLCTRASIAALTRVLTLSTVIVTASADGTGPNYYLTGFFSSRPGLKGYVRSSSITLQAARQLEVFTGGDGTGTEAAWEAIAVAQHHDAVAGTERQHVAYDYAMRIAKGMDSAYRTLDGALSQLAANGTARIDFHSCPLLNLSICAPIRQARDAFTVIVYNPQARPRYELLTLPLYTATNVTVTNSAGEVVASEVVPVPRTSAHTAESAPRAVVFSPSGDSRSPLPGLGFETFSIKPVSSSHRRWSTCRRLRSHSGYVGMGSPPTRLSQLCMAPSGGDGVSIRQRRSVQLTFDNSTGLVQSRGPTCALRRWCTSWASRLYWYYIPPARRVSDGVSSNAVHVPGGRTMVPRSSPSPTPAIRLSVFIGRAMCRLLHQRVERLADADLAAEQRAAAGRRWSGPLGPVGVPATA